MGFFSFLVLLGIAYLLWRVTDQLPDLIFRLSEVQRDVADVRRSLSESSAQTGATTPPAATSTPSSAAKTADDGADADSDS